MNWYKKAQSKQNFNVWLSNQIQQLTENFSKGMGHYEYYIPKIEEWVKDTNPNLDDFDFNKAAASALAHEHKEYQDWSPEQIKRNMNRFRFKSQRINPDAPNFAVDIRDKSIKIPQRSRKTINDALYDLGNYHTEIPLQSIFDICRKENVIAIQEDGTPWSGFLTGGAECGSEKAKNQNAKFDLAIQGVDGEYVPAENMIILNWCKMQSGKYEIVCYVS